MLYDLGSQGYRPSARQHWTPSQTQLTILERLYERTNGTSNKNKIRDITSELSQQGPISETNFIIDFKIAKLEQRENNKLNLKLILMGNHREIRRSGLKLN